MSTETSLPTCYRHPDRETRLSCSSCERPTCVDCVRSAAVGQKCVDCAAPQGRATVIRGRDLSPTSGAPVTKAVLVLCAVVFVLGFVDDGLLASVGAQFNEAVRSGQWYRLISAAFLHDGAMHRLFNRWALYAFGPQLERSAGSAAFAGLYFASALAGGAAFFLLGPTRGIAVGASGAIFGLFGAWLAEAVRSRNTLRGRAQLNQLLFLLGINAALGLVVPGIAWQAHLGGLIAGFVIVLTWRAVGERRDRQPLRALVAVAVGALALG
ncbi:MAG: rhomboid family intramembrane serine protease, partial [Gemmatimonadales bacterium]